MTHCPGFAAAAVARSQDVRALGIDAEPHLPLPSEVLDKVAVDAERRHLDGLELRHPATQWDRLLFCAKEAVYKVWSPLTDSWLGFHDAEIHFHPQAAEQGSGTLAFQLRVPGLVLESGRVERLHGRWCLVADRLIVAVWLPSST
jgi:4'-phosphopantetheinyl transferase EntD